MEAKPEIYHPQVFRNFQGFRVRDLKEWRDDRRMEIILERIEAKEQFCSRCNCQLGAYKDQYRVKAKHLQMMGWQVEVVFFREQRYCPTCKKYRSEKIDFICDTTPHVTKEMAFWISRLTE